MTGIGVGDDGKEGDDAEARGDDESRNDGSVSVPAVGLGQKGYGSDSVKRLINTNIY